MVTDNASNCKAAGAILEARFPHLFAAGCTPHVVDLWMEDVPKHLPRVRTLVKTIKKVVKFITKNQRPLAIYKAKAKSMLKRPGLTR